MSKLICAALLIAATLLLGLAVEPLQAMDLRIANALTFRTGETSLALITFMQAVSWVGGGVPRWVVVGLLSLIVWRWHGWRGAFMLSMASLCASLASSALKAGFGRARPDLIAHLDIVSNASYPSGHATNTAVLYLLLAWFAPLRWRGPLWVLAGAMILLNGLSRVMLGVHWPIDIVGGTMLGAAFAVLGAWWVSRGIRES